MLLRRVLHRRSERVQGIYLSRVCIACMYMGQAFWCARLIPVYALHCVDNVRVDLKKRRWQAVSDVCPV